MIDYSDILHKINQNLSSFFGSTFWLTKRLQAPSCSTGLGARGSGARGLFRGAVALALDYD